MTILAVSWHARASAVCANLRVDAPLRLRNDSDFEKVEPVCEDILSCDGAMRHNWLTGLIESPGSVTFTSIMVLNHMQSPDIKQLTGRTCKGQFPRLLMAEWVKLLRDRTRPLRRNMD